MAILGRVPKKEKHKRIPKEDVDILKYRPLLRGVLNKFAIAYGPWINMWEDDLMQEGHIGLMKALEKYDPERGTFVTIAWLKVHTEMSRKLNCKGGLLQVFKHEISFEDLSKVAGSQDGTDVTWEETFEGGSVDYQALVWYFSDWRDRRAAVCIFEQFPKKKIQSILNEPMEEATERCERVFGEMLALVGLWYGGDEREFPSLEEFRAMKPTKYFKREKHNG